MIAPTTMAITKQMNAIGTQVTRAFPPSSCLTRSRVARSHKMIGWNSNGMYLVASSLFGSVKVGHDAFDGGVADEDDETDDEQQHRYGHTLVRRVSGGLDFI